MANVSKPLLLPSLDGLGIGTEDADSAMASAEMTGRSFLAA
ncbi:hypothetical protein EDE11_13318 [Methylomonas methanica]|uniref:Uncharacterized protein n=1 Tax=Methylomonas methanica TaxID=421 RepID=A0ABY2CK00_METMH|nr:hypothetical protein EDE11_13318 [Methylomonas methanica]